MASSKSQIVLNSLLLAALMVVISISVADAASIPMPKQFSTLTALIASSDSSSDSNDRSVAQWIVLVVSVTLMFLFGLLFCFFGYKLFKFMIALCGFFLGFLLGYSIFMAIAYEIDSDVSDVVQWAGFAVGIVIGIIVGFIAWFIYLVGIFIVGSGIGVFVTIFIDLTVYQSLDVADWLSETLFWVTLVVLAIVFGFIAIKLQKFMIIVGSAAIGSLLMIFTVYYLIMATPAEKHVESWLKYVAASVAVVLWIAGTLVQYRFTALHEWHEENDRLDRRAFV